MRLTTLMEILEQEIGVSTSARSQLALMLSERAEKDAAGKPRSRATKPLEHGAGRARRTVRKG